MTHLATLFAVGLAFVFGLFEVTSVTQTADVIANIFLKILRLISMPIIFFSLLATLTSMNHLGKAKVLLYKTLKYTLTTTLIAAFIGLILFYLFHPVYQKPGPIPPIEGEPLHFWSYLLSTIPDNPIKPFLENNVLGVAVMAVVLSLAISHVPSKQRETLQSFFQGLFTALLKITSFIIKLLPIGVFAFTLQFIVSCKSSASGSNALLIYGICILSANILQGIIVLPLLLKRKGIGPLRLARAMLPALTTAFFSKSSGATLPVALDCAKRRAGINEETSNFTLPLCSVINMNGCAAFILITTLFVATSSGLSFSFMQMVPWVFIATLAAVGNAGVPMGCYFLTTVLLIGMKVPLALMGLILPLYSLFDMVETALNVWSDSAVTACIDKEVQGQALGTSFG